MVDFYTFECGCGQFFIHLRVIYTIVVDFYCEGSFINLCEFYTFEGPTRINVLLHIIHDEVTSILLNSAYNANAFPTLLGIPE